MGYYQNHLLRNFDTFDKSRHPICSSLGKVACSFKESSVVAFVQLMTTVMMIFSCGETPKKLLNGKKQPPLRGHHHMNDDICGEDYDDGMRGG